MNRALPASGPRYRAQFQNGAHQVFDTVFYAPVDVKPSAKAAEARAAELNARHAARPPRKGAKR